MKDRENLEAELLLAVEQESAAFRDASYRCRERRKGTLQQCLEQVAHKYRAALHAFSDLILNGGHEKKPRPGAAPRKTIPERSA